MNKLFIVPKKKKESLVEKTANSEIDEELIDSSIAFTPHRKISHPWYFSLITQQEAAR